MKSFIPKFKSVMEVFEFGKQIKYDNFTEEEKYFIRTPEQVVRDKLAICYDSVEFLREALTHLKLTPATFFFYEHTDMSTAPTHTVLLYPQIPNGEVFFLPTDKQPDRNHRSVTGKFWHTGVIYQDKIYELFADHRHTVTSSAARLPELQELGAVILPTVINPWLLVTQLTSGTSCGSYVARVLGMSQAVNAVKTHWPEAVYQRLVKGQQWMWIELSWYISRGIWGPYATQEEVLRGIARTQTTAKFNPWKKSQWVPYKQFDYQGMNILQFGEYILKHHD